MGARWLRAGLVALLAFGVAASAARAKEPVKPEDVPPPPPPVVVTPVAVAPVAQPVVIVPPPPSFSPSIGFPVYTSPYPLTWGQDFELRGSLWSDFALGGRSA